MEKNSKMVILSENTGRNRNAAGEMVMNSLTLEIGVQDGENITSVGHLTVSANNVTFHGNGNAPITDIQKTSEVIARVLVGEKK
jgi:hypothetical protein